MKNLLVLFGLMLLMSIVAGKHIHPRSLVKIEETDVINKSENNADIDGTSIEVLRNIRPNRFVPINSVFFFKNYPPCENGMERDYIGVCREVW